MPTLPKYQLGRPDLSGLPGWFTNVEPINFMDEVYRRQQQEQANQINEIKAQEAARIQADQEAERDAIKARYEEIKSKGGDVTTEDILSALQESRMQTADGPGLLAVLEAQRRLEEQDSNDEYRDILKEQIRDRIRRGGAGGSDKRKMYFNELGEVQVFDNEADAASSGFVFKTRPDTYDIRQAQRTREKIRAQQEDSRAATATQDESDSGYEDLLDKLLARFKPDERQVVGRVRAKKAQ